jgi:hypothetical protein
MTGLTRRPARYTDQPGTEECEHRTPVRGYWGPVPFPRWS